MPLDGGLSFHGKIQFETKVAPGGSLQLLALQVVAWLSWHVDTAAASELRV